MIVAEQQMQEVIAGCKSGDRKAQEKLYRSFYKAMMNLCLRYTKNDQDAMEALNTGFYKVFKNIGRYDAAQSQLYTWIRTIVINSCIDLNKVNLRSAQPVELEEGINASIPPDIIAQLSAENLLGTIRKLPAATQTVFNLFIMEGYSHKEIAGLLKISEGTSKWHVNEARKKLQTILQEPNNQ